MRPGETRYWRERRVHGDLRLLIGTAEQKAEALRQIQRRSEAAKRGWVKRRAAIAMEARRGGTPKSDPTAEGGDSAGPQDIAQ